MSGGEGAGRARDYNDDDQPQPYQRRRGSDGLLVQVLQSQEVLRSSLDAMAKTFNDYLNKEAERRIEEAERRGDTNARLEDVEKDREFLMKRSSIHEKWINVQTGKMAASSFFFGLIGAGVIWIADHLFGGKLH